MRVSIDISVPESGKTVRGRIVYLHPNEIRVMVQDPFDAITASRHSFFTKSENRFAAEGIPTEFGLKTATELLAGIYQKCLYFQKNRETLRQDYAPVRARLKALHAELKESLPDFKSGSLSGESMKKHQDVMERIFWINHEFFKDAGQKHPELKDLGLDTFMELVKKFLD